MDHDRAEGEGVGPQAREGFFGGRLVWTLGPFSGPKPKMWRINICSEVAKSTRLHHTQLGVGRC